MSQQQTDRELVLNRLREHFQRKDFSANDSLLAGIDPHDALSLLTEAMEAEWGSHEIHTEPRSIKYAHVFLFVVWVVVMLFAMPLQMPFESVFFFTGFVLICWLILVSMHLYYQLVAHVSMCQRRWANAQRPVPDLARKIERVEALPVLLTLACLLLETGDDSGSEAIREVEEAIYRVLTQTKGVSSVLLSEAQKDYLRTLLQRRRQKDEVVVAVLLLLASARDVKLLPIAADLAQSAPSEHVRMVAAEVYQELQ